MTNQISLQINGTSHTQQKGITREEAMEAFDHVLRAIALSDSPVLVEGGDQVTRAQIAERLHNLGRRSSQPLRVCSTVRECKKLISSLVDGANWNHTLGTWVLRGITGWPMGRQRELSALLERLDQDRFSAGAKHDKVPRVIVLLAENELKDALVPQLQRRLSFFNISLTGQNLEVAR